jgi:type I restriction enzyme S subunit
MAVNQVGLAKLVKAHYGKALKKENRDESGAFEVFGSSGQVGFHTDVLCDYPTLIIGRKGSVGEVSWAPRGGWIIDTAYYLEILDSGKLDLRYLFYALRKANLAKKTITTSIPGLNRDDFYDTKIPLPSLPEQKRIAAILDKADSLRRKNQQAIQLADKFLRAVFLDMFGDPVTNPKGWPVEKVGAITDCIVPGRDKPKSFTGNIPWVTTNDVIHLGVTYEPNEFIGLTENEIKEAKSKIVPKNSILMTCVGDLGVLSIAGRDIVINQQLHAFLPSSKINNVFLMYALAFQKSYMLQMASNTTVPYMNKTICNSVPLILPEIKLQSKFCETFEKVKNNLKKLKVGDASSRLLFDSLSQKAFSGDL